MSKTWDRVTFALDDEIEMKHVDDLVERSEFSSRSEYIRSLIKSDRDDR